MSKKKEVGENKSKIAGVIAELTKKHKDVAIFTGSDIDAFSYQKIPTGIFELDIGLGGGVPTGRFTIVTGVESSGKTLSMMLALGNCQRVLKKPALLIDAEKSFDKAWAERLGVNTAKDMLYVIQPDIAETSLDIVAACIRSNEFSFIGVDSLEALTPKLEVEESIEKSVMGKPAQMMNRAFRIWQAALNSLSNKRVPVCEQPVLYLINQPRDGFSRFGGYVVLPKGRGQRHATSNIINFKVSEKILEKTDSEVLVNKGIQVTFFLEKSKVGTPYKTGTFFIWTKEGSPYLVGNPEGILKYAVKYGLISKAGAWYIIKETGEKYQGKEKVCLHIYEEEEKWKTLLIEKMKEAPETSSEWKEKEDDGDAFE